MHIKAFSRSELLLASQAPVGLSLSPSPSPWLAPPPIRSPSGSCSPSPVEALPGTWQISEKPAGQIGTNETKQEGGEGRQGGGGMTPGLALLFPSLIFSANNPVNALERLWKSPAPRLGWVWDRWVPAGGDSPHPAPPASLQPPGPERGPSWDRKGGRAVSPDISICFGAGWGGQGGKALGAAEGLTCRAGQGTKTHQGPGRGKRSPC